MSAPSSSPPAIPSSPPPSQPPPTSISPPPAASSPPKSQPNANADPPTSSTPPSPVASSPPTPLPSSPPPIPSSPPPSSPQPVASPPPPITASPPLSAPPPPVVTPPVFSPPPPAAAAPPISPPSPPLSTPSPPTVVPSPPADSPPPAVTASPPPPAKQSAETPPKPSSPPPPAVTAPPKTSPSSPPAVVSPPPPELQSPPTRSPSAPSTNVTQPTPPASPPGDSPSVPPSLPGSPPSSSSPSVPPSLPGSPPSNSSPSGQSLPPTTNGSPPVTQLVPIAPDGPNSSKASNPVPDSTSSGTINSSGGGIKAGTAIGIAVGVSFLVLGLIGIVLWSVKKRKKREGGFSGGYKNVFPSPIQSSQMSDSPYARGPLDMKSTSGSYGFPYSPSDPGLGHSKSLFTYEELSQVTNGFSIQNLLGEGGFGCVYKGHLPDGRIVAVKQLKDGGGQGEREFRAEVEIISRIHHRHLVSLVGYCIAEHQRLLVYDYVPNNTLHYHLHGSGRPVMDWGTRLKVALGAARGLAYLHEDCHPRVIHRDIKSSNILLDYNFEAQVSDFGLAKLAMDTNTHVTTRVMGTFGYLAPEYASSGKLTDKSDVFSFGVMLLELITGRKPVDASQPLGDESLVEWARPLMSQAIETENFGVLPDPRLEKNYNESEMFRMIEVAAVCVRHSAAMRPRMGQVVRALDGLGDSLDLHNGIRPGHSELFNSAQQSAEIRLFQRMAFGSQEYSSDFSEMGWKSRTDL